MLNLQSGEYRFYCHSIQFVCQDLIKSLSQALIKSFVHNCFLPSMFCGLVISVLLTIEGD